MGHVKGVSRDQGTLFPERLDNLIAADSPVRVIDAFIDQLDLQGLGFTRMPAPEPGRPSYDPGDLLKLYVYGYMNRLRSSRNLEAACQRNIEVLRLLRSPCARASRRSRRSARTTGRRCTGGAVRSCCSRAGRVVAIDGSKFEADNAMERHCTRAQVQGELDRIDRRIGACLEQLDCADANDSEAGGGGDGGDPSPEAVERARATLRERRERLEEVHQVMQATGGQGAGADRCRQPQDAHRAGSVDHRLQRPAGGRCRAWADHRARGHHRRQRPGPAGTAGARRAGGTRLAGR